MHKKWISILRFMLGKKTSSLQHAMRGEVTCLFFKDICYLHNMIIYAIMCNIQRWSSLFWHLIFLFNELKSRICKKSLKNKRIKIYDLYVIYYNLVDLINKIVSCKNVHGSISKHMCVSEKLNGREKNAGNFLNRRPWIEFHSFSP